MFMTQTLRWFARRGCCREVSVLSVLIWNFGGVCGGSAVELRGVGEDGAVRWLPKKRAVTRAKLPRPAERVRPLRGAE
jgi:hypothetical protein